jgi:hypothetical protein
LGRFLGSGISNGFIYYYWEGEKEKKSGRARASTWVVTVGAFARFAVFIVVIFATAITPIPATSVVVVAVVAVFVSFPFWMGALPFCFLYTLLRFT